MSYSYGVENVSVELVGAKTVLFSADLIRYKDGVSDIVVRELRQENIEIFSMDKMVANIRTFLFTLAQADWEKVQQIPELEDRIRTIVWTPEGQS